VEMEIALVVKKREVGKRTASVESQLCHVSLDETCTADNRRERGRLVRPLYLS
jgi:hypothetical protein